MHLDAISGVTLVPQRIQVTGIILGIILMEALVKRLSLFIEMASSDPRSRRDCGRLPGGAPVSSARLSRAQLLSGSDIRLGRAATHMPHSRSQCRWFQSPQFQRPSGAQ